MRKILVFEALCFFTVPIIVGFTAYGVIWGLGFLISGKGGK